MEISPLLLKGIVGAGALSTVAVGGTYLYTTMGTNSSNPTTDNNEPTTNNLESIDNFALDYDRTWTLASSTQVTNSPFEASITVSTTENTKTWSCQIKGTTSEDEAKSSLNLDAQKEELKTSLGIDDSSKKRNKNKRHNFTTFFNKCNEKRSATSTETTFTSVIDSVSITKDSTDSKYKFDKTAFKSIYDGTNEIIKELGLETKDLNNEHPLDKTKLEAIKFEGKTGLTIPENTSVKIKIEKTDDTAIFPEGLKFTFINDKDIKIQTSNSNHISIVADTNTEFKVKVTEEGAYSLEKAWDITKLAQKVNLTCSSDGGNKTCSLPSEKSTNVYQSDTVNRKGAKFTLSDDKKINFTEGEKGYNQGFKLKASADIDLTESGTPAKLLKDKSYEVGFKTISGSGDWYLIELDEQTIKEHLVNLQCDSTNSTCSAITDKKVKGITLGDGKTLTRTKEESGNVYTYSDSAVSGTSTKYKIDCSGDECVLKSAGNG